MQNRISVIFIFVIAMIFAIVAGTNIAMEEYETLGIYGTVVIVLYFFIHGWKNVWWFAALLIFSGVMFWQGFVFESDHLFVMMLVLASMMSLLTHRANPVPMEMRLAGSRSTLLIIGALLAYGTVHFLFNFILPYDPAQYSLKTCTKAYFECFASMACFFWLLGGPYGFNLKPGWGKGLLWILFFALLGNVAVRGYMYLMGFQAADGLSEGGFEEFFLYVPVINMQAGIYALRNLCPIAIVILLMVATSPGWWRSQKNLIRLLVLAAVALCLIGAIFSGGRATVLFCLVLIFMVGVARRQLAVIGVLGMAGVMVVALANIFSYEINKNAPFYVARSLQLVMIEKGETYETIEESQYVRNEAIKAALAEWRDDARVMLIGRSVYAMSFQDAQHARVMGTDGFIENALRSGRTHNMITDLLLQYGAIGLALYLVAYMAVIRYYWRLAAIIPREVTLSKALAEAMKIYLPLMFVYQMLGGNYMPSVAALVVGLIRADLIALHLRVANPGKADLRSEAEPVHRNQPALVRT